MSIYKRGKYWYVSLMVRGKRIQVSTHSEDRAEALYIDRMTKEKLTGDTSYKLNEVLKKAVSKDDEMNVTHLSNLDKLQQEYTLQEGVAIKRKTLQSRSSLCRKLEEFAYDCGISYIESITSEVAWRYVNSLNVTAKRKQNIVGELSAVWSCLIRHGLINKNPWKYARPKANRIEQRSGRAFSIDEMRRILDASKCTPWLHMSIMIALYTGLRQGDVFSLRYEDIDFDNNLIRITPSKTARFGRKVCIPLHPALAQSIERNCTGLIIKNHPSKPQIEWHLTLQRAGIISNEYEMMTFHNLRHTFATWVRDAGASKGEQMLLGGWTNLSTSNRYDHSIGRLKTLVDSMPSI